MEQKNKTSPEAREKLKTIERELLENHREWSQEKAQWMAKKLLFMA